MIRAMLVLDINPEFQLDIIPLDRETGIRSNGIRSNQQIGIRSNGIKSKGIISMY